MSFSPKELKKATVNVNVNRKTVSHPRTKLDCIHCLRVKHYRNTYGCRSTDACFSYEEHQVLLSGIWTAVTISTLNRGQNNKMQDFVFNILMWRQQGKRRISDLLKLPADLHSKFSTIYVQKGIESRPQTNNTYNQKIPRWDWNLASSFRIIYLGKLHFKSQFISILGSIWAEP